MPWLIAARPRPMAFGAHFSACRYSSSAPRKSFFESKKLPQLMWKLKAVRGLSRSAFARFSDSPIRLRLPSRNHV